MNKDARITVRIPADLEQWLTQEAQSLGLDLAAYVRMILFKTRSQEPHEEEIIEEPFIPPQSKDEFEAIIAQRLQEAELKLGRQPIVQAEREIDPVIEELGAKPLRPAVPRRVSQTSGAIKRIAVGPG